MRKLVFQDISNRRVVFVTGFLVVLSTAILFWIVAFVVSIYFFDKLPSKVAFDRQVHTSLTRLNGILDEIPKLPSGFSPIRSAAKLPQSNAARPGCKGNRDLTPGREVFAHDPYWNAWAQDSLAQHCAAIDLLLPEW